MTSNPGGKAGEAAPASHSHGALSAADAAWFRMEVGGNRADIVTLMSVEGEIDPIRLRATIEERVLNGPRFRRRVVESAHGILAPHWDEEVPFSTDAHLSQCRVPPPGGEAELLATINELVNTPMDFSRAPWRLWILDGVTSGSVLVAQVHHCIGDGFALIDVLMSLADEEPTKEATRPPAPAPHDVRARSHIYGIPEHRLIDGVLRAGLRASHGVADLGHLLALPFDPATRLRGVPSGARRLAWSKGVPVSSVKAIAASSGATINDVLLAAVAGALRRYLAGHGDPTPGIRAIVPVNLRPRSEPVDLEHGNWFGLVLVDLPVGVESRDQRVSEVKRSMDRIKASEEPVVSLAVLSALGRCPAAIEHLGSEIFGRKSSIVVSNVPGPRRPISLCGRRVRDMLFWVPHPSGLACGASILSYAGMVRVGVRSDVAVVPDPELIARHFDEELLPL